MKSTSLQVKRRDDFISFARGAGILSIVLFHYCEFLPRIDMFSDAFRLLGSGIYIFLFASSYGLALSKNNSWTEFYKRRFLKVLIPYYVGIALIFFINTFVKIYPDGWPEFLSHIFLYKMFDEDLTYSFGKHFWFISTIIQFYLIYPLLVRWTTKWNPVPVIITSLIISITYSTVVLLLGLSNNRVWYSFILQYLPILMFGLIVAKTQLLPKLTGYSTLFYMVFFPTNCFIAWAITKYTGEAGNILNDYFMFFAFMSGCILLYRIGKAIPWLLRFFLWMESFSYPFYILHMFVLAIYIQQTGLSLLRWADLPILLLLTSIAALIFGRITEKLLTWLSPLRVKTIPE